MNRQNLSNLTVEEIFELGIDHLEGHNEQEINLDKAFECFQIAADRSYVPAWHPMGQCYEFGLGVEQNKKRHLNGTS